MFAGVSQEVLSIGVDSLLKAAELIRAMNVCEFSLIPLPQNLFQKPLHAHLFLIKHLLILREQTAPFRSPTVDVRDTTVDFSKIRDSARTLMADKSRWFALNSNNALLEFILQVPVHVTERVG